jgi:hypothetical protein
MSNRTIGKVKETYESQLLAIPGVIGVGIGLTQDRRETCIKVYVDRRVSEAGAEIPKEIEGYPVEVELRGTFRSVK